MEPKNRKKKKRETFRYSLLATALTFISNAIWAQSTGERNSNTSF